MTTRQYRPLRSNVLPSACAVWLPTGPRIAVEGPSVDWPDLWNKVQHELRRLNYAVSTLVQYRQILRNFRTFAVTRHNSGLRAEHPCDVTRPLVRAFIHHVNRECASWSRLSSNISVLRAVFDKLAGFTVTNGLRTPRRPWRLPQTISPSDATKLIESADTIRDRLIIGLLYGCGLKVGELCALRWQDILISNRTIAILFARGSQTRQVPIPDVLMETLTTGTLKCPPTDFIFPGQTPDRHLSVRLVERMIRRVAEAAGIEKPVTCMVLRHSYAVECLRHGMNPVQLKQYLGHGNLETTLEYQRLNLPDDTRSPADNLRQADITTESTHITACPALPATAFQLPPPLPFPTIPSRLQGIVNAMKTHIRGRFLALRRFAGNTS